MIIRPLVADDISAVLDCIQNAGAEAEWLDRLRFDPSYVALSLATFIERPNYLAIGCQIEADGELAGFLIAELGSPWYTPTVIASEKMFYVRPEHRKNGVARRLIKHYLGWAEEQGVPEENIGNGLGIAPDKVRKLCEDLGFQAVGFILKRTRR